ncbi:MAG: EamA family transporter [Candidatus Dojkabacteria bacterium]|nr:EamA family transporter [Candidatus Dojkabacteria bacterium]
MTSWVLITILVAVLAGSWRIIIRGTKQGGNDLAFTVLAEIIGGVSILVFLPFYHFTVPTDLEIWLLLILSGIILSLSDYLVAYSSVHADTADASILMPFSNIFVLISAVIFLREELTRNKLISVVLIIVGTIITLYSRKRLVINKGVLAALLYGIVIAINFTIDKGISDNFSLPLYAFLIYIISGLCLSIFLGRNKIKTLVQEFKLQKKVVIGVGVVWGLFLLALLTAYSYGEASEVVPFMRIFIVFVTIYSIVVLKEHERLVRKLIGSIVVTCGAILLAYG